MFIHPNLAVKLIPFSELEIIFKKFFLDRLDQELTFEAFLSGLPQEQQRKISCMLEKECRHEKISSADSFTGNVEIYRHLRYYPSELHSHDFFECFYMLEGSCEIELSDKKLCFKEEDFCLIPPGTMHKVSLFGSGILISFLIQKDYFTNSFSSFLTVQNHMSSFFSQGMYMRNKNSYILFHTFGDENIRKILETILLEYTSHTEYSNLLIETFLSSALTLLLKNHLESAECCSDSFIATPLIAQIQTYLRANIQSATLKSVAEHFNYSVSYLSRMISAKTNGTFSDILRSERIRKACALLVNTNLKISDITEQVGYTNQHQFNQIFKAETGLSPSAYRAEHTQHSQTKKQP